MRTRKRVLAPLAVLFTAPGLPMVVGAYEDLADDSRWEKLTPRMCLTHSPQLHIATAHQFPPFLPELPVSEQRKDLYAGLGVVVFDGPQGRGFYKGGHDSQTANTTVCIGASQRCVLILSNDVRSEAGFADLVRFILGDTGVPYDWEYGDRAGKS
jgi:hypothetical protein